MVRNSADYQTVWVRQWLTLCDNGETTGADTVTEIERFFHPLLMENGINKIYFHPIRGKRAFSLKGPKGYSIICNPAQEKHFIYFSIAHEIAEIEADQDLIGYLSTEIREIFCQERAAEILAPKAKMAEIIQRTVNPVEIQKTFFPEFSPIMIAFRIARMNTKKAMVLRFGQKVCRYYCPHSHLVYDDFLPDSLRQWRLYGYSDFKYIGLER